MPYILGAPRDIVDPLINDIVREIKDTADRTSIDRVPLCVQRLVDFDRSFTLFRRIDRSAEESDVQQLANICRLEFVDAQLEGVLNYIFTRIVVGTFIQHYPCAFKDWAYQDIARVVRTFTRTMFKVQATCDGLILSALECAKMEFYCRVAVPKERLARINNGDILEYIEPDVFP